CFSANGVVSRMHYAKFFKRRNAWVAGALLLCVGCAHGSQYYLDRGNRFFSENRYSDAILNYRNGLQRDPDSAELHFRLGLEEAKVENWPESYQQLVRAIELAPKRNEYRVELADFALRSYQANPHKPKVLYDQIDGTSRFLLGKDPNSFDGLRFRGDLLAID